MAILPLAAIVGLIRIAYFGWQRRPGGINGVLYLLPERKLSHA
jgi:hypothetical protein